MPPSQTCSPLFCIPTLSQAPEYPYNLQFQGLCPLKRQYGVEKIWVEEGALATLVVCC